MTLLAGCAPASGDPPEEWENRAEEESAVRVCADGPTVEGIDVSYWQDGIDWSAVASSDVEFAFIRVSDGATFSDPRFRENWRGAREVGLIRGVYQFFRPAQDPREQAELLLEALAADPLQEGDLPPVLDIESVGGVSNTTLRARMQTWLDIVEEGTGRRPLIYTAAFMQGPVGTGFSDYPLWAANYTSQCPLVPTGWTDWDFWQYTDSGDIPGISGPVDRNVWNGTLDDLLAFAGAGASGGDEPPPPEDPPPSDEPDVDPLDAPSGLSPEDGDHVDGSADAGSSVRLACEPFTGASRYQFEVELFDGQWQPYYTYAPSSPAKTFWPVLDAAFRFRVRAELDGAWTDPSAWSTFSFGDAVLP